MAKRVGLYLQTTTWLCNYSSTISCRQSTALPVAKRNDLHCNHQGSLVNFQSTYFQSIMFFFFPLHTPPDLCNIQRNYSQLTLTHWALYLRRAQPITFHISFPVCARIDVAQTPIKRSPLALNLPAFMPRALEMERGLPRVTVLRVLIQRNPCCCSPLITHEPCVCIQPLLQQHASDSGQRSGDIEVFIYLLLIHTVVSLCP